MKKNRNRFAAVLAAAAMVSCTFAGTTEAFVSAANYPTAYMNDATIDLATDSYVTVEVYLDDLPEVQSVSGTLNIDGTDLSASGFSVQDIGIFGKDAQHLGADQYGNFTLLPADGTDLATIHCLLFTLTVVGEIEEGTHDLSVSQLYWVYADNNSIPLEVSPATLTVLKPTEDFIQPGDTTGPDASGAAPRINLANADVDMSGMVDQSDLRNILRYITGAVSLPLPGGSSSSGIPVDNKEELTKYGDVNGDGKINLADAAVLARYLDYGNFSGDLSAEGIEEYGCVSVRDAQFDPDTDRYAEIDIVFDELHPNITCISGSLTLDGTKVRDSGFTVGEIRTHNSISLTSFYLAEGSFAMAATEGEEFSYGEDVKGISFYVLPDFGTNLAPGTVYTISLEDLVLTDALGNVYTPEIASGNLYVRSHEEFTTELPTQAPEPDETTTETSAPVETTTETSASVEITTEPTETEEAETEASAETTTESSETTEGAENLPQTGRNSWNAMLTFGGAASMMTLGLWAVVQSGVLRRKNDAE